MMAAAVVSFTILGLAAVPGAPGPSSGAIVSADPLSHGIDLYHAFEFEQAVFAFEQAAIDTELDPKERARALVWLGMAQGAASKTGAAQASFKRALSLDREAQLPEAVSPKLEELFAEAKAAVDATPPRKAPPPPPPPPPPDPSVVPSPMLYAGFGAVGAGALLGIAAGGSYLFALSKAAEAEDPKTFQDDAKGALDTANVAAGIAIGAGLLAGAAVAGGGVLLGIALSEE
jgi:hypothetical protein